MGGKLDQGLAVDLKELGRRIFAGAVGGFVCGLIIGGAGGRLAMFVLRVTTGDSVTGVESDDGFTIGFFTSDTLFLLGATAFLGAFVGIVYSLLRGWLPDRIRGAATGGFLALAGGAAIIRPGGVDFTLLKPLPLAIALIVLLPGLYGVAMSAVVERILDRPVGRVTPWLGLGAGAFALVAVGATAVLGLVLVIVLVWLILRGTAGSRRLSKLRTLPAQPGVVWAVRGSFVLASLFAAVLLGRDIVQVL
jgi:hypothetical protein